MGKDRKGKKGIFPFALLISMYILGISAFYHDSSAALIKDGEIIAAAEEERFTRIKHDNRFPFKAIDFCLKSAGIGVEEINRVAYYEKPLLKFERIFQTFTETYPFSLLPFIKTIPEWFGEKIKVEWIIRKKVGFKGKLLFIPHHLSHAAGTYFTSPFRKAAVLTIDGVGEYQTAVLWQANGNSINPLKSVNFPNSLGLFYSTFTAFLGFKVNSDEYKVMGLAAYGKPKYLDKLYETIDIAGDGSFKLNLSYFSFREKMVMWSKKFEKLFGAPRRRGEKVTQRHKDIAASLQTVTEEAYFKMLKHLYAFTKSKNLCVSGGVGLNALANGKIFERTSFKKIHIFGPAGDGGTSAGAALFTYHSILGKEKLDKKRTLLLGTRYGNEEIERELKTAGVKYRKFANEKELVGRAATSLAKGAVVGWFQGRMELGPRALGARSILAKPYPREMKDKVNLIKRRESFRPFAGSVLKSKARSLFEIKTPESEFPYMNFCFKVREKKRKELGAIVHEDNTCRIQTVDKEEGLYYRLIREFYLTSGIPCILNTSFNLAGEPIVESPDQAIRDFKKTKMDFLAIGGFWVWKT